MNDLHLVVTQTICNAVIETLERLQQEKSEGQQEPT